METFLNSQNSTRRRAPQANACGVEGEEWTSKMEERRVGMAEIEGRKSFMEEFGGGNGQKEDREGMEDSSRQRKGAEGKIRAESPNCHFHISGRPPRRPFGSLSARPSLFSFLRNPPTMVG